jgi:hypothetical protein
LRAKNTSDEVYSATKWRDLRKKNFPVLFHCGFCQSKKDENDFSSYNEGEIETVLRYVIKLIKFGIGDKKITAEDIGVVTPYKAQSEKLKKVLPKDVEVGTTEYFQGREKLIMIISTVKSKADIGFLADARRLNVCLTRAKALMIVVGNAETLQVKLNKNFLIKKSQIYFKFQKDKVWRKFIVYCKENDACVGAKFNMIEKKRKRNPKLSKNRKPNMKKEVELKLESPKESDQKTTTKDDDLGDTDSIIDDRETKEDYESELKDMHQELIEKISKIEISVKN